MKNQLTKNSVYDTTIRLIVLLLIIAWCLMIMMPFANIILWSLILSLALYPTHHGISMKLGDRPKLASFIIVIAALVLIILPTWLLIDSLIHEIKEVKLAYDEGTLKIPPPSEKVRDWPIIGESLYNFWKTASANLAQTAAKYQDQLTNLGTKLAKGIFSAAGSVIQLLIAFVIACIILVFKGAGEPVRRFFRKLAGARGDEFADVTLKTVGNVVKGILGVALLLALMHGVAFYLAGVPYAGIWTLFVFILAVLQIPLFFVTLPVIIFFFATKSVLAAIIWAIVLVVIGFSDNILRPILLAKGAPVPMLVIFIGVIGGFIFTGFSGLFTGAIIMSLGYKLFISWIESDGETEEADPAALAGD